MHKRYSIHINHEEIAYAEITHPGSHYEVATLAVVPEHRRKSYGRRVMKMVCDDADRNREHLTILAAGSFDAMTTKQLEAWYARFGFVLQPGGTMVRLPRIR